VNTKLSGDRRLGPDERAELTLAGAERGRDREGASALGGAEREREPGGRGGQRDGECVSPSRSTTVRLDPTILRLEARSVTIATVPSGCRRPAATAATSRPPSGRACQQLLVDEGLNGTTGDPPERTDES
jgi:hypothetical protein